MSDKTRIPELTTDSLMEFLENVIGHTPPSVFESPTRNVQPGNKPITDLYNMRMSDIPEAMRIPSIPIDAKLGDIQQYIRNGYVTTEQILELDDRYFKAKGIHLFERDDTKLPKPNNDPMEYVDLGSPPPEHQKAPPSKRRYTGAPITKPTPKPKPEIQPTATKLHIPANASLRSVLLSKRSPFWNATSAEQNWNAKYDKYGKNLTQDNLLVLEAFDRLKSNCPLDDLGIEKLRSTGPQGNVVDFVF
jgi:hypothetical protein